MHILKDIAIAVGIVVAIFVLFGGGMLAILAWGFGKGGR